MEIEQDGQGPEPAPGEGVAFPAEEQREAITQPAKLLRIAVDVPRDRRTQRFVVSVLVAFLPWLVAVNWLEILRREGPRA